MNTIIEKLKQDPEEVFKTIKKKKFLELLQFLSDAYSNKEALVSDQLFDVIKEEYEKKYGEYKIVGADEICDDDDKIKLDYFMGSLKKPDPNSSEYNNWIKKNKGPYVISYKLDGASGLLLCKNINDPFIKENKIKYDLNDVITFNNGEKGLYLLLTRGNGTEGMNISHCLKRMNIIKNLNIGEAIRGELIISKTNFLTIASDFSDARAAVVGIIKKENSPYVHLVEFRPYYVFNPLMKISDQYAFIQNMNPVEHFIFEKLNTTEISKILIDARTNYNYDIDGLVICDDSKIHENSTKKYPSHMIAFKQILTDQIAETTILHIEWNISKFNTFIPTAIVSPVIIAGREYNRATAHNARYVVENGLATGSRIEIIRSKDVIPKIHKILKPSDSGKPDMPKEPYEWDETRVNIYGVKNNDPKHANNITILKKQLAHTFSKLNIKNMGEESVLKFIENDFNTLWKILYAEQAELYEIEGFGIKSITKLYEEFKKKLKKTSMEQLASASNCFDKGLGEKKFKTVFDEYPNFIELYKTDSNNAKNLLINIHGIEDKTADKIINGMEEFIKWYNLFIQYKKDFNIISEEIKKPIIEFKNNKYSGMSICFSGVRDDELEKKLIESGAVIVSGVSKKTNLLIVKDKTASSTKITKAHELGIEIINIDEVGI